MFIQNSVLFSIRFLWTYLVRTSSVARNLHWEGGLFWKLKTKSNYLDPNFDWASLRLTWFFCPNLGDLQKTKQKKKKKIKVFTEIEMVFLPKFR